MITKIGHDFYNGQKKDLYLLVGTACRDAEVRLIGDGEKRVCKVSVAAGKRQNTETVFVTLNAWNKNASWLSNVHKSDRCLAVGSIKTSEYNGKNYQDMDVEFVSVCAAPGDLQRLAQAAAAVPSPPPNVTAEDWAELEDEDEELPF